AKRVIRLTIAGQRTATTLGDEKRDRRQPRLEPGWPAIFDQVHVRAVPVLVAGQPIAVVQIQLDGWPQDVVASVFGIERRARREWREEQFDICGRRDLLAIALDTPPDRFGPVADLLP